MAGSILKDIGLYKDRLITAFLNSTDICGLLLDRPATAEDKDTLVYTQIFPYLYVDKTKSEEQACLCIEADIPQIPTRMMKEASLNLWVYCPYEKMKYTQNGFPGTRVDILADMISRELMDSSGFGIGAPTLLSVKYFSPKENYYGKQLVYKISDFKIKET